jgi:gamma-glutamyltranspeptidase/glutathione hydrolase
MPRSGHVHRPRLTPLVALTIAVAACAPRGPAIPADWPFAGDTTAVQAAQGMVVTTDGYASEVGVSVLRAGGNAVDAAVATAFALAVVNPEAGNLGGGGFMLLRLSDGRAAALDFRERAPRAAARNMYLDADGRLTHASVEGHRAVGVPGTVAGLWEAHRRYGKLPWADVVAPAIRLAEGFVVRERLALSLAMIGTKLNDFPATARIFLPRGRVLGVGDTLVQSDLAETLRRIQRAGRDGFYAGRTADLFAAEMRRGGGLITKEDLAAYRPAWREPIRFTYRGDTVLSMPPSSSGGVTLAMIAGILEGYDLGGLQWHSPRHIHLLTEAFRRAYADRNALLGDPDFVTIPLARLMSPEYAAARRATISLGRATPSRDVGPGAGGSGEGPHTTHFSIVDSSGNAVAVTTTINSFYGIRAVVEGAGFLLNNEMDDFSAKPGSPNQFGLVQGEANAIAPGKRPLSAMTPTIVLTGEGRLLLVLGTPGGSTIITNVFQNISNVLDFGMSVARAVSAPRIHHQHLPDEIGYEPGSLTAVTIAALRAMGHTVKERGSPDAAYPYIGDIQAILVRADGMLEGASDPRRHGTAVGY